MRKLDVLFAVPANLSQVYQGLAEEHAIEPPAKARFVASYLMRRGRGVHLVDAALEGFSPERMAEEVYYTDPRLVVMPVYGFNPSSSTQMMPAARMFAAAIKRRCPEKPILMMGTHPAALPEQTLREEPIDFVCGGEGPITVHELLQALEAGGEISDLERVRSLWYRTSKGIFHGAPAPLIDLNQEPVSREAWRLMDPRRYRAHDWHTFYRDYADRGPYANPYSREGCPFSCGFCNIQAPFREGEGVSATPNRNSFRELRPELFIEELTFLVEEFGVRYLKIPDEMFGLGYHPLQIADAIYERFGDQLNIWCYYRVDTCKPQHLERLRRAGFRWLGLGIEAANSQVRSGQEKMFSDEHIHQVVERLHAAGLEGGLNYIFGLPGDTMTSMEETFRLACDLNGAFANFYCNQALPGSPQYKEAVANHYPLPGRPEGPGWIGHSQYSRETEPFYMGEGLKPPQILAFRDWAQATYYTRPEYLSRIGNDSNFGEVALRNIATSVERVRKLKRRIFGDRAFAELPPEEQARLVPLSQTFRKS